MKIARNTTPYCIKTVAVLNSWGKIRSWGCHMVHHALYQKQNYSYAGIIEALSGAPFDVKFISFADLKEDAAILDDGRCHHQCRRRRYRAYWRCSLGGRTNYGKDSCICTQRRRIYRRG